MRKPPQTYVCGVCIILRLVCTPVKPNIIQKLRKVTISVVVNRKNVIILLAYINDN